MNPTSNQPNQGPLAGVRILDFTANMSGPMATMILGDQGADVIKVEPLTGDIFRGMGTGAGDVTAYFGNLNRSKRSLALDLADPDTRPIIGSLVGRADVIVQNYRPGVAEKLGLDAATLRALNPRAIYVEITGFGPAGPYGGRPAYDHVIQALSGFAARQEVGGDPPGMVRQGIIDKMTGQHTAQAITAALLERVRTGTGRSLQIRMLDVAVATLWPDGMMNHTLVEPEYSQPSVAHTFRLTPTADGHVSFILVTAIRLKRLATALGIEGAEDLPTKGALRSGGSFVKEATARISAMTTADAVELLASLEIPVAPVVKLDELHEHPQIVACGSVDEFDHPVMGRVRQANPAVRFDGERAGDLRPAPHIGQDGEEVLRELGLSADEIADLRERGVLGGGVPAGVGA